MQKKIIGVYGCSGFGRSIPLVSDQADEVSNHGSSTKIYFVDDNPPSESLMAPSIELGKILGS